MFATRDSFAAEKKTLSVSLTLTSNFIKFKGFLNSAFEHSARGLKLVLYRSCLWFVVFSYWIHLNSSSFFILSSHVISFIRFHTLIWKAPNSFFFFSYRPVDVFLSFFFKGSHSSFLFLLNASFATIIFLYFTHR